MEFRLLTKKSDIEASQSLLYDVYIQEMGWLPEENNPSGIEILQSYKTNLLIDNYDDYALWFGVYIENKLAACWRLCPPIKGLFELEKYHHLPDFLKRARSLEITRLAIQEEYRRSTSVLVQLALGTAQYLGKRFDYTFATAQFPEPGQLYLRLGAKKIGNPFKYSEKDDNEVVLTYFDLNDRSTLLARRVQRFNRPIHKPSQSLTIAMGI